MALPPWQEIRGFIGEEFRPMVKSISVEMAAEYPGKFQLATLQNMSEKMPSSTVKHGPTSKLYAWSEALMKCSAAWNERTKVRAELATQRTVKEETSADMSAA